MRGGPELARFAREARTILMRETDLAQFEVYCSSAEQTVVRVNYTSDIPSRGVEEAKSNSSDGFALRIVLSGRNEVGFGAEAGDLSSEAVRGALSKARRAATEDPHFPGLPAPVRERPRTTPRQNLLMATKPGTLVAAGWRIVGGALREISKRKSAMPETPGVIVGGDVSLTRERIAITGSNFPGVLADSGAQVRSSVTALIEATGGKGTATALGSSTAILRDEVPQLGGRAVARAFALRDGQRLAAGTYRVVLGSQPVAEILNYMVMGSLTTGAFFAGNSAYQGRFGEQVMDPCLSLSDDPDAGAVARRITCEGFRARRIDLIRSGHLVGLLSDVYDSHRLSTDEGRIAKLGAQGANREFAPLSGYRLGEDGARRFASRPGASGTNVRMGAHGGVSEAELIRRVRDGIYVGRVWYTYPINGQRAGDFTCTVTGDSHIIRGGRLAGALTPNCLRINANLRQVFARVLAAGRRAAPAMVWGAPEAYYVPALALEGIELSEVGEAG